jgi:DNA-binding NarL/FixJ family response regulator
MSPSRAGRAHLLVRDHALRAALAQVLADAHWGIEPHARLAELLQATQTTGELAILDWTMADGLLADEHRRDLIELGQRIRLVLLVPDAWLRHLSAADLGVAALVPKAWAADDLLPTLEAIAGVDAMPAEVAARN